MRLHNVFPVYASTVIILSIFQACSSVPVNLDLAKEEVIQYHDSGKFDEETSKVVDEAIDKFEAVHAKKNSAVIFDVDETALSNYEYNKKYDFGYVPDLWDKWIKEAKAPPIKEIKHLYDFLISKNFKIIFITGRKEYEYDATYHNLIYAGYTKFDTLIVRTPVEYEIPAAQYKSLKRAELVKIGYNIIGDVGDQWSDLTGPYHGIQVKIPNYQYLIK